MIFTELVSFCSIIRFDFTIGNDNILLPSFDCAAYLSTNYIRISFGVVIGIKLLLYYI